MVDWTFLGVAALGVVGTLGAVVAVSIGRA